VQIPPLKSFENVQFSYKKTCNYVQILYYSGMKRTIIHQLQLWKDSKNRRPLILMGARQVGKTWVMQEF
jgi:predicted AAA+ superfamily ATPase